MSDPYRPNYYEQDTTYRHHSYKPGDYTPQSALQLSQSRPQGPSSPNVYAPVGPYLGGAQSDSSDDDRRSGHSHRRRRRHSRSERRGRHSDGDSSGNERDRSRSKSRVKEVGATLAGAAIAGLAGRKLGKENKLITVGAALAGGYAAHELEKRREDRAHSRRGSGPMSPQNHSSIGSVVAGAQHRVEHLLSPKDAHQRRDRDRDSEYDYRSKSRDDRHGRRKDSYDYEYEKRSRSHGGYANGGGRRGRYYDDSD